MMYGRAVDASSGSGVSGAIVSLRNLDNRSASPPVATDHQGRFLFEYLQPGSYELTVRKAGYSDAVYGRRISDGPSQTLELSAGDRITDLVVSLTKLGAISGVLRDPTGEPVHAAVITALRRTFAGAVQRIDVARTAVTDDRGVYRLPHLRDGEYLVAKLASTTGRDAHNTLRSNHPTTFYPSSTSLAEAQIIALTPGEERDAVDLTLSSQGVTVTGSVIGIEGPVTIRLQAQSWQGFANFDVAKTATNNKGGFTFPSVAPGAYSLKVVQFPAAPAGAVQRAEGFIMREAVTIVPPVPPAATMWGEASIDVNVQPVRVDVVTQPAARIRGRVTFKGNRDAPEGFTLPTIPLLVTPADGRNLEQYPLSRIDSTGEFQTVGMPPGRYTISLSIPPPLRAWTVLSVTHGGLEFAGSSVELGATDLSELSIVLTDQPCELVGLVTSKDGVGRPNAIVYVFPTARRLWRDYGFSSPRIIRVFSVAHGVFKISGILPGEYFVATGLPSGVRWPSELAMERLAARASKVTFKPGERQSIQLREP